MVGFDSCVIFLPFFFLYMDESFVIKNKMEHVTDLSFLAIIPGLNFIQSIFRFFCIFFLSDSFCFVISCRDLFYFIFILILGFILSLMRVIRGPFGYFINRFTRIKKKSLT
jgi:hypothetical protein